jgi:two-component system phosphate regulon sensor histidine kinase PhoR
MARIRVRDHGPGIEQEHLGHLFKRFYRVPGKSTSLRGTGLGLFICRQITQAHHGEISVSSNIGEGTTFTILLPTNDNHAYDDHANDNHSEDSSVLKEAQV